MTVLEQTPEFLELIAADDAAEADTFAEVDAFFARRLTEILAELGDGRGRRVLVIDYLDRFQLQFLSRWVGRQGRVDLVVGPAGEPEEVESALADAVITNGHLLESAPAGVYDLIVGSRTLYWDAPDSPARDEYLAWLAARASDGAAVILTEFDFEGWQFLPAAPALETLNQMVFDAFGYQFRAAQELPRVLARLGYDCHLEANTTILPADSGLGRRIISRARAFVETGGFPQSVAPVLDQAAEELADPGRWVLHPTVVVGWGRRRSTIETVGSAVGR